MLCLVSFKERDKGKKRKEEKEREMEEEYNGGCMIYIYFSFYCGHFVYLDT